MTITDTFTPSSNGHKPRALRAAEDLLKRQLMPFPLKEGSKHGGSVLGEEWQTKILGEDYEMAVFNTDHLNVAMRLGHVTAKDGTVLTDRFVDADLDTHYATLAAQYYLPPTGMMWGRKSKRRSHYGYRVTTMNGAHERKFEITAAALPKRPGKQKTKNMICELRLSGITVAPGSINTEDGPEPVEYEPDGDGAPSDVDFTALERPMEFVAAAALMTEFWQDGVRHTLALPFAGLLCYGGLPQDDAETLQRVICNITGETHADTENRLGCVRDTYAKEARGEPYTGGKTLEEHLGKTVVNTLRKWLHLQQQSAGVNLYGPDGLPLAHDGDGDRFVRMFGSRVIYSARENTYYLYNGSYWMPDDKEEVHELAKLVGDDFRAQVADLFKTNPSRFGRDGVGTVKQCTEWALHMGDTGRITAMLDSARSRPPIVVVPEELDSNPVYFNVANWTLEFDTKSGNVSGHLQRPEDFCTMIAPVTYDPTLTLDDVPLLREYRDLFFPEEERWRFLWEVAAEAVTGLPKRNSLNLIGPHNAGKSMTLALVGNTFGMGNGYAASLRFESLERSRHGGGDKPRADLWRIRRKRLVTVTEVPPDAVLDVALYKALLGGGDRVAIRDLFAKAREITDVQWAISLWFSGNRDYGPPPSEDAAYARSLPLRCEHVMPQENEDDEKQRETLTSPQVRSVVLNLLIEGIQRLYGENHGRLKAPDAVKEERTALQNRRDPWSEIVDKLFEFTGNPDDAVLKEEAWNLAKTERIAELGTDYLPQHDKQKGLFEESMSRSGRAREFRSRARWDNRRGWQYVRWSEWATKVWHNLTPPDWR
jgi:phage/plasmid-associated DNA primase